MQGQTIHGSRLGGWDVIAGLVGLGTALALQWLQPDGWPFKVLWIGAPAAMVVARRSFLPQLNPPSDEAKTPSTPMRRVSGYVLMIVGGFGMFIDGIVLWVMINERAPLPIAIALGIFGVAGWIASRGYRRVA
jgi:hypothetical protein